MVLLDLFFLGAISEELDNVPKKKRKFRVDKLRLTKKELDRLSFGFK